MHFNNHPEDYYRKTPVFKTRISRRADTVLGHLGKWARLTPRDGA